MKPAELCKDLACTVRREAFPPRVWQRGDMIGHAFLKDHAGCSITNGLRRSKDGSRRVTQATTVIPEQDGGGG